MNFKEERILIHNNFPMKKEFKAEILFRERLEFFENKAPFKTIELIHNNHDLNNKDFQISIGHLIDGLEALPYRPDYMFDHCFRILDESGGMFYNEKGIKGVVQNLGAKLLTQSNNYWREIIDLLTKNVPLMTCRYLALKIISSKECVSKEDKEINKRVIDCIGEDLYNDFCENFKECNRNNIKSDESEKNAEKINNAASFLRQLLRGTKASKKSSHNNKLDLTKENNLLSYQKRAEIILSLLLFTMRNERTHGSKLTPFKTSNSSLERYESYYYAMLSSYIFSLGVFELHSYGGVNSKKIMELTNLCINAQYKFFQKVKTKKLKDNVLFE